MTTRTTLPRRANTIRQLSASMAARKLTEVAARQSISDRIGYAVAALLGAVAFRYEGWPAVDVLLVLYGVSAFIAYRHWRQLVRENAR